MRYFKDSTDEDPACHFPDEEFLGWEHTASYALRDVAANPTR